MVGEQILYTITEELDGWYENYSSVSEFKNDLTPDLLSSEEDSLGWVFWCPERDYGGGESSLSNSTIEFDDVPRRRVQEQLIVPLKKITSKFPVWSYSLIQFWASRVYGGRCYLTTLHQPFAVNCLNKGSHWYRKQCMEHYYIVDDGSKEERVGPPERVFRNRHPESSPDLRLYSTEEFPLRNHAASCGFVMYMVLPVFHLHHNQCVGVLEVLFRDPTLQYEIYTTIGFNWFQMFNEALEEAMMKSTHIQNLENEQQIPSEILDMLEWAIKMLPQLHMAQVWADCKQCDSVSCMERAAFIDNVKEKMNTERYDDKNTYNFIKACRFHKVQNGQGVVGLALSSPNKSCFCRNLCDFTISEYPMAHYAQLARLSFCFAITLQSKQSVNDLYVIEFFLQSQSREDAYIWSILQLMEMKLKNFKIASGLHLGEELVVDEVCKKYMFTSPELGPNTVFPLKFEIIKHGRKKEHQNSKENTFAMRMEGYKEMYSVTEFTECLQKTDLSYLRVKNPMGGWIFWSMEGEELSENEGNVNSKLHVNPVQQKVKHLLKELSSRWPEEPNRLIQFWAHKMIDNRSFLATSDQPFALGFLCEGLCKLRKQCMQYCYYVDDGTKEDELGPPGRVFLNCLPESTPDLRLYSTTEFPLRDFVVFCGGRRYLALPLFDAYQEQCVGVLEVVEFSSWSRYDFDLECIGEILKKTELRSTHINCRSSLQASHHPNTNNGDGQQLALMEINRMFKLLAKIPQLHLAQVCVPCFQCANIMQQAHYQINDNTGYDELSQEFVNACRLHQVHTEKGVSGRVLKSRNKLCFCQNLCDFSIIEQPLAHYAQVDRLDTYFAIGLQSSHSKDSLYLLEFFLYPGSNKDGYPWSFLRFLLQIMKQNLTSFKVASGQQFGDELIVEVMKETEYTSFRLDQLRFQVVEYGHQMGHQHFNNQGVPIECMDSARNVVATTTTLEDRITTKKRNKDRNKISFHISYNALKPHFGKKLIDVAEELGVSKSTFKRACRDCGILRWPNWRNKKNPSLFEATDANKLVQNCDPQISIPSTSNSQFSESDLPIQQNVQSTQQVTKESAPEDDMIMVRATFNDDTMKIQLCLSLGMEKLKEEVRERLKLKVGSFKLKYLDEDDGDWILLACDDDLHLCVKRLRSLGKTTVQVLVQLVSV